MDYSKELAYIVGVSLGDGNLSCPNGRAVRLRITCDSTYPATAEEISKNLKIILPNNKVTTVPRPTESCFDISVYSNELNTLIPWKVGRGSKFKQNAHVPKWILSKREYIKPCLKGLIQTDGSIYFDRGYKMINFTNVTEILTDDVYQMIRKLGYTPHKYTTKQKTGNYKYTIRLSKSVEDFIQEINLTKN